MRKSSRCELMTWALIASFLFTGPLPSMACEMDMDSGACCCPSDQDVQTPSIQPAECGCMGADQEAPSADMAIPTQVKPFGLWPTSVSIDQPSLGQTRLILGSTPIAKKRSVHGPPRLRAPPIQHT